MFHFKRFKQSRGQTLIEAALSAPLIFFYGCMVCLCYACIHQISTAARSDTDLIAYTSFGKEYIEDDIKDYPYNVRIIGRTLDADRLDIKIETNDSETVEYDFDDIKIIFNIVKFNPKDIIN